MQAWNRRKICLVLGLLLTSRPAHAEERIAAIERATAGRLGVMVRDTETGHRLAYRADESFPLCSTFKMLAVAQVLARADAGLEDLRRTMSYGTADLDSYAPVAAAKLAAGQGRMSLDEACAAAMVWSDNTAANLILQALGGPEALTAWLRGLGDASTRLDRTEPDLNTAIPGDPRDTTTPAAMAATVERILLGPVLSETARHRIEAWMAEARTGTKRLRAGLPTDWTVGDKTGSGANGTTNVVALLRPPGRAPLVAAIYLTQSAAPAEARDTAHAAIGRLVAGGL